MTSAGTKPQPRTPSGPDHTLSPILVVDDNPDILEFLVKTLEAEGYLCAAAKSVGEAIGRAASRPPALVIVDILIPGLSSREFIKLLRQGEGETAVITTGRPAQIDLCLRSTRAGAYDYLIKPFSPEEVLAAGARALRKRALILARRDYRSALNGQAREPLLRTIGTLLRALAARDPETRKHSLRVAEHSVRTARELGLPPEETEKIRVASTLHDIGKIGISKRILDKSGPLLDTEIRHIRRHPEIAASILEPIEDLREIVNLVRWHHENYDGSGYPEGLAGEEIPIGSRIIAVADAFDAISHNRPYHRARGKIFAAGELKKNAGSQFDPRVVEAFLRALGRSERVRTGAKR